MRDAAIAAPGMAAAIPPDMTTTTTEMIRDAGDYAEMLFIVHQTGGWIELGAGFLNVVFPSISEAQAYCSATAKFMTPDVTLQPAKEHNGRPVGVAVRGSRVEVAR